MVFLRFYIVINREHFVETLSKVGFIFGLVYDIIGGVSTNV